MKLAPAQFSTPMVGKDGILTTHWVKWLQQIADSLLVFRKSAENPAPNPPMKKEELIAYEATTLGITYLVFYDGVNFHKYQEVFDDGARIAGDVWYLVSAGAPVDGTAGTGAGKAGAGSICSDSVNGVLYINSNTKESPLWTMVGLQST